LKSVNLKGATVIDGFPSELITNSIASQCFLRSIDTQLIGIIDSPVFDQLTIVKNELPSYPVRIYANEKLNVAIFISDIKIEPTMYHPIGKAILQWAKDSGCKLIISASSIIESNNVENSISDYTIYGIGNTEQTRMKLKSSNITIFGNGSLSGLPAILLNKGSLNGLEVMVLIVRVLEGIPDYRAAAELSKAIIALVPGIKCDISLLINQAEMIEKDLKKIRNQNNAVNLYG
jgi:uncharacterized protein